MSEPITQDHGLLPGEVKERIRSARYEALRAINKELISPYRDIGRPIVEQQWDAGWGLSVVEPLAGDLQAEFPSIKEFSAANLWRKRPFYDTYACREKLAPMVREIGWCFKTQTIVEYTLREFTKPIGVASYKVVSTLPEKLRGRLPAPD